MLLHPTSTTPSSRTRRRASAGAVLVAGLTALTALTGVAAAPSAAAASAVRVHHVSAPLTDLQPATPDPLDGARASLLVVTRRASSTFVLTVSGVAPAAVGHTYGAHLHTGPCVAGNGAAAGSHYNESVVEGVVPPVVSDRTEVWLDVTIGAGGTATAVARVPFVPMPGAHSVVLHAEATDAHGTAGARLACLPVVWS